ncbi:MAG: hypothetical protein LBV16_04665 [Elusimicrobiota bacterium]|jgi:hypothetical protein|nr:hypothetical protein [Elusimicrobiota bacterium]
MKKQTIVALMLAFLFAVNSFAFDTKDYSQMMDYIGRPAPSNYYIDFQDGTFAAYKSEVIQFDGYSASSGVQTHDGKVDFVSILLVTKSDSIRNEQRELITDFLSSKGFVLEEKKEPSAGQRIFSYRKKGKIVVSLIETDKSITVDRSYRIVLMINARKGI